MWEQKGNGNTRKNNSTTCGNKPESTGERNQIEEISTKGKTIQTKQDMPKQRKKILSTTGRRTQKHTNNRMPKKPNDFGLKYGNQKNITKRLNG